MSTKVSTGFGWLEDDVTGDPTGVRRHSDGKEFTIPLVETDPVTGVVEILAPGDAVGTGSGAKIVGWKPEGAGSVARTVKDKLDEFISVKDYGVVGGEADATAAFQAAANKAKSVGVGLRITKGSGGAYRLNGVDVAGLVVKIDPGATFEAPAGATGFAFTALGSPSARITKRTRISGAVHDGKGTQLGLFQGKYCDDVLVELCSGADYPLASGEGVQLTECINPVVYDSKVESGRMGVVFISCTSPLALGVKTTGQGRDGIAFYTDHAGTLTTDALAIGCVATSYCLNGEGGRGGIQFYGVRRCSALGCIVRDDNGQTNDDTAGIRFRDCEDFSVSGYTVSDCCSGVLVNSIGDYSDFGIVSRGSIGAGAVFNVLKYGVSVASSTTICPINGVSVSTVANTAGGAGIYHSGKGAISGCSVSDSQVAGIYASGVNSVVGNMLIRAGVGASSIPGVSVGGAAIVSGNVFVDDRGTPLSTLAIRILSGGAAMISQQSYGTGVTDFVVASAGSTVKRGSGPIQQKFAGVPTSLSGTVENGVTCLDANGIAYIYRSAWRMAYPKTLTATIEATQTTVAHGLGYTPTSVSIVPGADARVWQSAAADATNVYLTASVSASCMINVQ